MGHTHFHGHRQVDDDVVAFAGLQHVQNGVAHLQRVFRFGAGEALRGILKAEITLIFRCQLFHQLRAFHGDLLDLLLALAEHLLPLGDTHGIVKMDDGAGRALAGFKGLADDMLPALGQHLHRDVLRDHVVLDQSPQELILRLGGNSRSRIWRYPSFLVLSKIKLQKALSLCNKETGLCMQNLAVPLFLPPKRPLDNGPTTVSRCIGRAPSVLLAEALGTAAQRPVYSRPCIRLTPTGGSLYAGIGLLFPHHCVRCMLAGL